MQRSRIHTYLEIVVICSVLVTFVGCWGESTHPVSPKPDSGNSATSKEPVRPDPVEPERREEPSLRREDLPKLTPELIADAENLVMGSCSRCHAPLATDVLPRPAWEKAILAMADMAGETGQVPATPEEIAIALHWYEQQAPEQLEYFRYPPEQRLEFETYELTPRGLEAERIPAVSDIMMVRGDRGRPEGILVSELRSRRLMFLPYGNVNSSELLPYLGAVEFNYPASLSQADVDGKGRMDILVSSMGGMNPSNDVDGGSWVILRSDQGIEVQPLGGAMARACDLKGADFDDDGDTDFVVCSFGFRGPGKLFWLKSIQGQYVVKELDQRDGFVAAIIDDVDGDDDEDIIALLSQEHEVLIQYTNGGMGNFEPKVLLTFPHAAWGSSDLQRVDIDRDGDRDLILVNGDTLDDNTPKPTHGIRWVERKGDQYVEVHEILLLPGCERAAPGDLDGDGDLDMVGAAFFPQLPVDQWHKWDSVVWAENLTGDAKSWQIHTLEVGNPVHSAVLLDDVDQDGMVDVILGNYVWLRADGTPQTRRDYLTVMRRSK